MKIDNNNTNQLVSFIDKVKRAKTHDKNMITLITHNLLLDTQTRKVHWSQQHISSKNDFSSNDNIFGVVQIRCSQYNL